MTPIVRAERVGKRFGPTRALDGLSLEIASGIVYGLLGPNGAGKTTFIRVAATLLRPDEGRVTVAGIDVTGDPGAVRRRIGLAGQFAAVDGYQTGRENVEMVGRLYGLSNREARRRAGEVLERIGLAAAADRLVRTYSGGMKRRLDLAASLVGRPGVLFLDEPTTGLDPRSRLDLWGLIEEFVAEGSTILLTTQYLDEADRLADRIGVIDEGRLVAEGTAAQLKDRVGGALVAVRPRVEDRERVRALLTGLDDEEPRLDPATGTITVAALQGPDTLAEVVRRLDAVGIVPEDLGLHRPALDDVFLALTGHSVAEAEQARATRRRPRPVGARRRP